MLGWTTFSPAWQDILAGDLLIVRSLIGLVIFVATLLGVMTRPYRIPEAAAAAVGALLMVLSGVVRPGEALSVLAGQWNVFGLFLGLMVIAAVAEHAGIFDALAGQLARWAGGSARRLYVSVFLAGALITAFLSNDATALLLTPVVYTLVTRLRLPALPFLFACTFVADSASFLLPVSNPINVLVLDAFGGASSGLGPFLRTLLLPSLVCIAANLGLFLRLFRRPLAARYATDAAMGVQANDASPDAGPFFRVTLVGVVIIGLGYVLASMWGVPLSFAALGGSVLLLLGAAWSGTLDWRRLGREVSWPLFVGGMFVLVRGIEDLGATAPIGHALVALAQSQPVLAILVAAAGAALGANLINTLCMVDTPVQ